MADKDYRIYEDVKDMVEDEIEKITKKDELDDRCLEVLYKLVDIAKDVETVMAMHEYGGEFDMENGYSTRMYPHYMYDNGHSYRNRDSMGRYSRTGGYNGHMNNSYTYRNGYSRTGDIAAKLESMMSEATTDREREAIQRALEQM